MSLDSLDSLFNVTELYQTLMGGSMDSMQPVEEVEDVEVPIGTELQLTDARKGWTLWHLDDDGKKKYDTTKDWRVTAGPAHIRKINEENAKRGLPALMENFRKVFDTKQEALQFIAKYTLQALETELAKVKIPAHLVPQIITVVTMVNGNTLPGAKEANLVTAFRRECERLTRDQKTVKELVVFHAKRVFGDFDPDSPLRHEQFPKKTGRRNAARYYFELIDFLGEKMVYDVTPEDANAWRSKDGKIRGPGTLKVMFQGANAMFKVALKKHWCDENPFEDLFAEISRNANEYYQKRKKARKPHQITLLQALIGAAWHENKLICFAYLLAILEGLRLCEILRAPGSCIHLTGKYPCVIVTEIMAKFSTKKRFVPIAPGFNAWLPVFINVLQLKQICPFTESQYHEVSKRIRDSVGFPSGGKEEIRKDFTQGNQPIEHQMSAELRAWIEGHSEDVMRLNYDGDGSPEFSEELETMLDPVSVLGKMPAPLTLDELKACFPKPASRGGRSHKNYKARMEALRLANEKK